MSGRSLFGAGVRTIGVFFLAEAVYDALMAALKLASIDTGSRVPVSLDIIALVFRLITGAALLYAAPFIVIAVYGRAPVEGDR